MSEIKTKIINLGYEFFVKMEDIITLRRVKSPVS